MSDEFFCPDCGSMLVRKSYELPSECPQCKPKDKTLEEALSSYSKEQRKVFDIIRGEPGITAKEIGEIMNAKPSHVNKIVEKLVSEGSVIRKISGTKQAYKIYSSEYVEILKQTMPDRDKEIYALIRKGPKTLRELAAQTGVTIDSARRYINRLYPLLEFEAIDKLGTKIYFVPPEESANLSKLDIEILKTIKEAPQTVSTLAHRLKRSHKTLSEALERLESQTLIESAVKSGVKSYAISPPLKRYNKNRETA